MIGMGIRADDVRGDVFLFIDKGNKVGRFHAAKICQAAPGTKVLNVPMVGHHITTVLAGTQNLLSMLRACRSGQFTEMTAFIRSARREHAYQLINLINKAATRFPALTIRILSARAAHDRRYFQFGVNHIVNIAGRMIADSQFEEAAAYIRLFRPGILDLGSYQAVTGLLEQIVKTRSLVRTCQGSAVMYDLPPGAACTAIGPAPMPRTASALFDLM
jgi:hypothetical protein